MKNRTINIWDGEECYSKPLAKDSFVYNWFNHFGDLLFIGWKF